MPIQASDLIWRKSQVVTDGPTNGGRISHTQSVDGAKNNLFPDVSQAERTAGDVKDRKAFILVNNSDVITQTPYPDKTGLSLISPRVYVEKLGNGDDSVLFFATASPMRDTQSSITGSEQKYGAGVLASPANAATSTLVVDVKDWAAGAMFADGMTVRVSDKTSILDSVNNEEFHVIDTAGVSVNGDQITLTLVGTLANTYSAGSKVASVYEPGDIDTAVYDVVAQGGTIDSNYIVTDNRGTISDNWTITFSDASNFTVSGEFSGAQVSGTRNSDYTATNPNTSAPYFFISSSAWGGVFANGNTVTFKTDPAAIPLWVRRDVNAGASSISSNETIIVVDGESA